MGRGSNRALDSVTRASRGQLIKAELAMRKKGNWGKWQQVTNPHFHVHSNHLVRGAQFVQRNSVFSVLVREFELGGLDQKVTHLGVSSLSGVRPAWPEMQRIKDDLAGTDTTAIEVYPPKEEVIDAADMFHLWVLPGALPFSLADNRHQKALEFLST